MSKEFYEYISKKIIFYFEENDKNIISGTRYSLVLDNQKVIDELEGVFKEYAFNNKITSNWSYKPPNSLASTYNTFALKFNNNEVVIVFKTKGMTEDFLVTLRNTKTTMLIITESPVDSISKGTESLTSKGLPFHKDNIVKDMRKNIKSSMIDNVNKAILNFEITRYSKDINSNQSSILEYENILSILNSKNITKENFNSFRLLYDDNLKELNEKKLSSQLKENNKIFEQIDMSIKYGNIEKDLGKYYDSALLSKLLKSKEDSWFDNLTYADIKNSKDIKARSKDLPLEILETSVFLKEEDIALNKLEENTNFFICNDSLTNAGKRKKNILIFNKECKKELTLEINFNREIKKTDIETAEEFNTNKNNLIVKFTHQKESCSFHKLKILDKNIKNNNHELKICIIDISEDYFDDLKTSYLINYSKTKSHLYFTNNNNIIINNKNNNNIINHDIQENAIYECNYNNCLYLKIKDEFINSDRKINIKLLVNSILIPITVSMDIKKIIELTPMQAFKLKNKNKSSFKRIPDKNMFSLGTQDYYAKSEFLNDLNLEEVFINSGCFTLNINENGKINKLTSSIPKEIEESYTQLLNYYKSKGSLPSLTYYDQSLVNLAESYIKSIELFFESIKTEQVLNLHTKNILKLGVVEHLNKNKEICFTPLNPIMVYYQLVLQKENNNINNLGDLNNSFLKKLTCSNLLPYIQNDDKVLYKSVDFSKVNSFEWLYFAPVDNKKYKGARHFVSKLVFEKINEYISHFNFLFKNIDNNEFRINLLNTGDCKEILIGILKYFSKNLSINTDVNNITKFVINIYTNNINNFVYDFKNSFMILSEFDELKYFIENSGVTFD